MPPMSRKVEYVIHGPPPLTELPLSQPFHKPLSLSMRREQKTTPSDLRTLYHHSDFGSVSGECESNGFHSVTGVPATPVLPPTPPTVGFEADVQGPSESSEVVTHRSSALTPLNQHSPPTPDNTPPREPRLLLHPPILATQLSLVSTYAGSFKTAVEDLTSDSESLLSPDPQYHNPPAHPTHRQFPNGYPLSLRALHQPPKKAFARPETPESRSIGNHVGHNSDHLDDSQEDQKEQEEQEEQVFSQANPAVIAESLDLPGCSNWDGARAQNGIDGPEETNPDLHYAEFSQPSVQPDTAVQIRENTTVDVDLPISTSAEKLANIIGWTNSIEPQANDSKRISGVSTTSTIDAIVFDSSPISGRRSTLRKAAKNMSLRSASSPLPQSLRTSQYSAYDLPHRLVHKKVRLSNENRLSFSSEPSRFNNAASRTVSPKIEVIKVAVISDLSPPLHPSALAARRRSLSATSNKTPVSQNQTHVPLSPRQKAQRLSELQDVTDEDQSHVNVPWLDSSLPVPASSSSSHGNSVASNALSVRRQEAEKDLRRTLDQMESDRLLSSLQPVEQQPPHSPKSLHPDIHNVAEVSRIAVETKEPLSPGRMNRVTASSVSSGHIPKISMTSEPADPLSQAVASPGSSDWTALRAPSLLYTPFSQPSYQSASPEINEATAVSIFSHNNHSVQIIEANLAQESRAVQALRRDQYFKTQSPLRNPRPPPPLPANTSTAPVGIGIGIELNQQSGVGASEPTRKSLLPVRTDSLTKVLGSGVSLKNAKNRKASQDLDSRMHPFWRPRPFWDGVDGETNSETVEQDRSLDQNGPVNNTLGFPQRDTIFRGPGSLIRRISKRRRRNKAVERQASLSSLSKIRASQNLYKNSLLGINLKLMGIRDIHQRVFFAKQKKQDEKLEKRRAALRQSIGTSIIPQGDSRFPANSSGLIRV